MKNLDFKTTNSLLNGFELSTSFLVPSYFGQGKYKVKLLLHGEDSISSCCIRFLIDYLNLEEPEIDL